MGTGSRRLSPRVSGLELAAPLELRPEEPLVQKEYRMRSRTPISSRSWSARGVQHLVVAGAQSDHCIRTTTQAAAVHGFDVTLVSDAHTTTDAEHGGVHISAEQIVAHTNMYSAVSGTPAGTSPPSGTTGSTSHPYSDDRRGIIHSCTRRRRFRSRVSPATCDDPSRSTKDSENERDQTSSTSCTVMFPCVSRIRPGPRPLVRTRHPGCRRHVLASDRSGRQRSTVREHRVRCARGRCCRLPR